MTDDTKQTPDIVEQLCEATGYFHDSDAERLRVIAEESGQKAVGVVRAGVEREIERRDWRCVYFHSEDEDREYPPSNAFEYYRRHKRLQLEYEAAMDALPTVTNEHLREKQVFENAHQTLQDMAREHRAKAETAERHLLENGVELPEVNVP